jgi:hypothetical protein
MEGPPPVRISEFEFLLMHTETRISGIAPLLPALGIEWGLWLTTSTRPRASRQLPM